MYYENVYCQECGCEDACTRGQARCYKVNGKVAAFTDDERQLFRRALEDFSEKMTAVAVTL